MSRHQILANLNEKGISVTDVTVDAKAIVAYLRKCMVYNAHVQVYATEEKWCERVLEEKKWPMFCHSMADVLQIPGFLETALGFRSLVGMYFGGQTPLLYSLNAFWSQPAEGTPYKETHDWHRDGDDIKQLVMFAFGTDSKGAHLYQRGSHRIADAQLGYFYKQPPMSALEGVPGKAGTVFLSDTSGLHVGIRPDQPRLLLWARWGVSDPPKSYVWDKLSPLPRSLIGDRYPSDPALQHAIKLVVQ